MYRDRLREACRYPDRGGVIATDTGKEIRMSILQIHTLFTSSQGGWDAVAQTRPSALRLFVLLALPCSLIPPLMLEYAGHHVGAVLFPDTPRMAWSMAALFFLLAEWLTVPLMGWAIRSAAHSKGIATSEHESF